MQVEWESVLSYMTHHPRWFEDFGRRAPSSEHLREYRAVMPAEQRLWRRGYWLISQPPGTATVAQGWKLHVSATSRNSVRILRRALPVLRDAGVHFKFLMDPAAMREANGKSFSRAASGKFITVYPADEDEFRAVGTALTTALADFDGPYILSDRRFPGSRVVYYRYGGFVTTSRLNPLGMRELLIHEPDGTPTPDIRHPYWHLPDWVRDPFDTKNNTDIDTDSATDVGTTDTEAVHTDLADGRFRVTAALDFANRGGIYRGIDTRTGADVILREARPGVEIGPAGVDAVTVLRHEYDLLTELADTGLFVRPVSFFTQWEHAFLVEEYVDGTHLGHLSISQNPIYDINLEPARLSDYYARFQRLWSQVADAIRVCHERGIVLGDLSPTNIMVTPDDRIRIIDLESAFHEDVDEGAGLFTPGMVTRRAALAGHGDRRTDYYALGGIMLLCVLYCHPADVLDRTVPRRMFAEAAADLNLPAELVSLVTDLYDEEAPLPDPDLLRRRIERLPFGSAWSQPPPLALAVLPEAADGELHKRIESTLDGVVDFLNATADTVREDRLFPADLMVFETNPLSLAHGAYGCLYALQLLRGNVPEPLLAWALRRSTSRDAMPPGLYYGTAGVAWAQSALGLPELAVRTLRATGEHPGLLTESGVVTGASGYGMACLRLWRDTGLSEFLDRAGDVGAHLAGTAVPTGGIAHWEHPSGRTPLGYADGAAGVAMFLLALHGATGDRSFLELGRAALEHDLAYAEYLPSGVLSFPSVVPVDEHPSSVLRQYWDEGTAGILTTLLRYHHVTGDAGLRGRIDELLPDVRRKYTAFPQLFHGTSGLGNALLDAYEYLGDADLLGDAERAAAAVLCCAVDRPEGIVFPGEQILRESCDLATGSAGVVLFLDRLTRARPGARTNANFVLDDLLTADRSR